MALKKRGKRGKRWLKALVYNIVVVFALLCGVEGYLNYTLNNPANCPDWLLPAIKKYYLEYDEVVFQYHPDFVHYDSMLFYALSPGEFTFTNREFSNDFYVNSDGFRDDEQSLQAPKVVVLGDSYSMGWGVDQEATYVSLMEKALAYRVLNTGVSSYGTAREVASLARVNTDSLEYLVVQYCPNDLTENRHYVYNGRLEVSTKENWETASVHTVENSSYYLFKHLFTIPRLFNPAPQTAPDSVYIDYAMEDSLRKIDDAAAFLRIIKDSPHIPKHTKIIVFTLEAEYYNGRFVNKLQTLLEKEYASSYHDRMSFIDLTHHLDATSRYILDPHLNASGHASVAQQLIKHMKTLEDLPTYKYWLYDTGDTAITCTYKDGVKDGQFIGYWQNGHPSRSSSYQRGVKEGVEYDYNEQGVMIAKRSYSNDLQIGWEVRFNNGVAIDSVLFKQ